MRTNFDEWCTTLFAAGSERPNGYRRGEGQVACPPQFQTLGRLDSSSHAVDMNAKMLTGDADLVAAKHDYRLAERQLKMPLHSGERHLSLRALAEKHKPAVERHPDLGQGSFIQTPENLARRRKTKSRAASSHRNTAHIRLRVARIIKFLKADLNRIGKRHAHGVMFRRAYAEVNRGLLVGYAHAKTSATSRVRM
jgi:hypothetical protein